MRKIIYPTNGSLAVITPNPACELTLEQIAEKDVPKGLPYRIVDDSAFPVDGMFFSAWETDFTSEHAVITVNMAKAKAIGHDIRRKMRSDEFAPLDDQIMKQIPGTNAVAVEAARQDIRDKYAVMQELINAAETPDELKSALSMETA